MVEPGHAVILFDGVCNLCNGTVQFVIDRDPSGYFHFAALQSEAGAQLADRYGVPKAAGAPESVVVIEGGKFFDRSDAALRIAGRLGGLWPLLGAAQIIPRFVRDAAYRFIARNRYRWFGKTETCRVPTPALRARFLSGSSSAPAPPAELGGAAGGDRE
jgi:predicted DCC family thiol-disulfide oxidoreductase YuxK